MVKVEIGKLLDLQNGTDDALSFTDGEDYVTLLVHSQRLAAPFKGGIINAEEVIILRDFLNKVIEKENAKETDL